MATPLREVVIETVANWCGTAWPIPYVYRCLVRRFGLILDAALKYPLLRGWVGFCGEEPCSISKLVVEASSEFFVVRCWVIP